MPLCLFWAQARHGGFKRHAGDHPAVRRSPRISASQDAETFASLMQGERGDLVFSDPPYNVRTLPPSGLQAGFLDVARTDGRPRWKVGSIKDRRLR